MMHFLLYRLGLKCWVTFFFFQSNFIYTSNTYTTYNTNMTLTYDTNIYTYNILTNYTTCTYTTYTCTTLQYGTKKKRKN